MAGSQITGVRVQMVTASFDKMLADLAAIDPAVEFRTVVNAVALRVIQGAANRTRAAHAGAIRANWKSKEWTTIDGKKVKLSWREPDALYQSIRTKRDATLAYKLASRGLAKLSWVYLAARIGGSITVPAYVSAANYKGRTYQQDADHSEEGSGAGYALTIINSSPIVQRAGGAFALLAAMSGEAGYFRQNMAHKFYLTAASRAAKYPGIFVTEAL